jgi:hypothetical protein
MREWVDKIMSSGYDKYVIAEFFHTQEKHISDMLGEECVLSIMKTPKGFGIFKNNELHSEGYTIKSAFQSSGLFKMMKIYKPRTKSKLTSNDVLDIERRLKAGERQEYIARRYRVSQSTISQIKRGRYIGKYEKPKFVYDKRKKVYCRDIVAVKYLHKIGYDLEWMINAFGYSTTTIRGIINGDKKYR